MRKLALFTKVRESALTQCLSAVAINAKLLITSEEHSVQDIRVDGKIARVFGTALVWPF